MNTRAEKIEAALKLIKAEAYGEKSWAKVVDLASQALSLPADPLPASEPKAYCSLCAIMDTSHVCPNRTASVEKAATEEGNDLRTDALTSGGVEPAHPSRNPSACSPSAFDQDPSVEGEKR